MSSVVVAIDDGGQDAGFIASSSINQVVVDGPQSVPLEVVVISGGVISTAQPLSVVVQCDGEVVSGAAVVAENWFGDLSLQLYNWRSLFYPGWWGI